MEAVHVDGIERIAAACEAAITALPRGQRGVEAATFWLRALPDACRQGLGDVTDSAPALFRILLAAGILPSLPSHSAMTAAIRLIASVSPLVTKRSARTWTAWFGSACDPESTITATLRASVTPTMIATLRSRPSPAPRRIGSTRRAPDQLTADLQAARDELERERGQAAERSNALIAERDSLTIKLAKSTQERDYFRQLENEHRKKNAPLVVECDRLAAELRAATDRHRAELASREREQGETAAALAEARTAQRDLSFSLQKLGDVDVQAGNPERARDLFALSVKITEALAKADPHSAQAQRDLSFSLERLGDVEAQAGKLTSVRDLFTEPDLVAQPGLFAEPEPEPSIFASLARLGDTEVQAGKLARARELFARCLEIRDTLAEAPPHSAQAQRDLYVSLNKLGDVEVQAGNIARARQLFARSLKVAEALAKADPHSAQAQRDLAASYGQMATVEVAALSWLMRAVKILAACHAQDPTNALVACDLACALVKLSNAHQHSDGDPSSVVELSRKAAAIFAALRRANALEARFIPIADQLAAAFPDA